MVPFGLDLRCGCASSDSDRIVQAARRRFRRHNAGRRFVEAEVLRGAGRQRPRRAGGRAPCAIASATTDEVRAALERMWPVLTPARAAARPVRVAGAAAAGRRQAGSTTTSRRRCYRPRADDPTTCVGPTADAALLDEARALLGPRRCATARPDVDGAGRDPHLRPHRHRRGPGPHADAAAHGDPPVPRRVDDGRGRHRPGHRAARPSRLVRSAAPPARSAAGSGHGARRWATASRPRPWRWRRGSCGWRRQRWRHPPRSARATSRRRSCGSSRRPRCRRPTDGRRAGRSVGGSIAVVVPDSMMAELTAALQSSGIDHGHRPA